MFINHLGNVLYGTNLINQNLWNMAIIIGRIAFPIYCFLLIEGYKHTHNIKKYILRMLMFAIISQVPYHYYKLACGTDVNLNILWLFVISLMALYLADKDKIFILPSYLLAASLCILLKVDYGLFGFLFILTLAKSKHRIIWSMLLLITYCWIYCSSFQFYSLMALPFLIIYNGEAGKSNKFIQYGYYLFYPLHLTLLVLGI